ncbi:transmembrane protein 199 [Phlebotomus papatasi]|uniref:transmembrane protein 199 n=1 Tax=Phlebotomus papatasi TaxID=29031 RepID=UPI0024836533|nr:transmembrane protein 199 [Phlebotomus papatasi]
MSKGSIVDPRLRIVASKKFCDYVQKHLADEKNLPENIARICGKISKSSQEENTRTYPSVIYTESEKKLLVTAEEVAENPTEEKKEERKPANNKEKTKKEQIIIVQDVKWLNGMLQEKRATASEPVYLHELLENCSVLLPENPIIERSPELEKRCETLRKEQENRNYRKMTRNVESYRNHPYEDSISYQIKQINKQLIAVAQFIFSVIAGFVFGFLGIQLIVGNLDFGFRLLLGIMFALIIALAEIYFLAKKLNENADEFKSASSPEHKSGFKTGPVPANGDKEHRD